MKNSAKADQNKKRSIPKDWDTINLGDRGIFEVIMGQSPPSSTYNKENHGLPFLQGKMEFCEIFPSPLVYCSKPIKIAEKNDILISVRAPVGDVNISPSKLCIGRGLASIRCNSQKILYLFLFYFMKHEGKKFENISSGSTFKAIRRSELDSFEVLLPPLNEQKKIAEILSTADQAIGKVEEAIEKIQRLKKGLMQELLTKGIGHKEFKETAIGRIAKEWRLKKLGDIALEVYRYPTYYNIEYSKEGVKEIRGELLKENGELDSDITKYRCISFETSRKFPRTVVKKGDFVMTVRGTMGKIGIVTESLEGANITANLMRISIDQSECDPNFYKYIFLSERFQKILSLLSPQTTIKTIQAPKLKSIRLPLPPTQEQQEIAKILGNVDKRIELLKNRKEKFEKIKKGLMEDLLTGRKRVKLES